MVQLAEVLFDSPYGEFSLRRYPLREHEQLRAWDAADEYLLNHLFESENLTAQSSILVLNDKFGAVSVALANYLPVSQGDSFIAHWSLEENLSANGFQTNTVERLSSLEELGGRTFDYILLRIPRSLAFLEFQLDSIRSCIHDESQIIGFAMAKEIHSSTLERFEMRLGSTRTSLAKKKARLVFCDPDSKVSNREPGRTKCYGVPELGLQIYSHANVFSRERLDNGSRLLIDQIPADSSLQEIADLGCGSGVLGTVAGLRNPQAKLYFVDESYMAVSSAELTAKAAALTNRMVFEAGDGLRNYRKQSLDLVLCNPPFHQQNVVGDFIAWRMFQQARVCLRRDGQLLIVGNRHLNYHVKLKRLFGNAKVIASNRKFVVIRSIKR